MTSDVLFIDRYCLTARIGVSSEERSAPQIIAISLRLCGTFSQAGSSGDLSKTVDYAAVARDVRSIVESGEFVLVETLAESLAASALSQDRVIQAWVRIEKNTVKGASGVGIEITRSKKTPAS